MSVEFSMVDQLDSGRFFTAGRKVRLGDVTPDGRLRLDALNRYTQDVSNDDTTDAELSEETAWVVRRTHVDVHQHASLGERLTLTTFCGALGRRWADRRISVRGEGGAHYEVATLWIHLDADSGRPLALSDQFLSIYGAAAGDRTVKAKLVLPKYDRESVSSQGEHRRWPSRAVDFDPQQHMNNAAYWAVFEELLAERTCPETFRATVEYGAGIAMDARVDLAITSDDDTLDVWWLATGGAGQADDQPEVAASGAVVPLSGPSD